MSMSRTACPVCKLSDPGVSVDVDKITYKCNRCGEYSISGTAEAVASQSDADPMLSAWIRERSVLGVEIPILNSNLRKDVVENLPDYLPIEKQQKLLQAISSMTSHPGQEVVMVPEHDLSLAWAHNEKEFVFYLKSLMERDFVEINSSEPRSLNDLIYPILITASGWEYLDRLQKPSLQFEQAFVAMSFEPSLYSIYENAIAPAVQNAGYRAHRVDSVPHLDRIDAKIISDIRQSRFIIADVTQQRPGVYYEAGFAHGLGLPVIWSVREDELENVHFDTRQYNHIVWKTEDQLLSDLQDIILATIGRNTS